MIYRFNIRTTLQLSSSFHLVPSRNVGARYSVDGQLFALLRLNDELSEDTRGGKLILNSCSSVLLAPTKEGKSPRGKGAEKAAPEVVYECAIAEKGKGEIYLTIPKKCVDELKLTTDMEMKVELQFQLNRYWILSLFFSHFRHKMLNFVRYLKFCMRETKAKTRGNGGHGLLGLSVI